MNHDLLHVVAFQPHREVGSGKIQGFQVAQEVCLVPRECSRRERVASQVSAAQEQELEEPRSAQRCGPTYSSFRFEWL
jgi:hypothetical protein